MKALKFSTVAKKIAMGSLVLGLALPFNQVKAAPTDDIAALKQQLAAMQQQMAQLQSQLKSIESKPVANTSSSTTSNGNAMTNAALTEEVEYLNKRLSKAELHTSTDKVSFGINLRSRVDSIHTEGVKANAAGNIDKYNTDNDLLFTTRLRLDMKSKLSDKFDFAGRIAMYKTWGDSTGVNYFDGTGNSVTYDGNTSSLPHGDTLHLERAYFNYKGSLGQSSTNFSVGRRPGTEGTPFEYRNGSLVGGSPLASIMNWQFDGISANFTLEDYTGLEGSAIKFCYGVGFEGDIIGDNQYQNQPGVPGTSGVKDVNFGGFIATIYDNDLTSYVVNYSRAWDVSDNFSGITYDTATGYTRQDPTVNLGTWDAISLLAKTNLIEAFDKDVDLFCSVSLSHTAPNSAHMATAMGGAGLLNDAGDDSSRLGHAIYLGAIFPVFENSKWGIEYNYGSKYWFNFTGAEDSLVGGKLAARGQVWETYFIQPIYKSNFVMTVGAKYYNYKYSNSGSSIGEPVRISDLTGRFMPASDNVLDMYISLDANF